MHAHSQVAARARAHIDSRARAKSFALPLCAGAVAYLLYIANKGEAGPPLAPWKRQAVIGSGSDCAARELKPGLLRAAGSRPVPSMPTPISAEDYLNDVVHPVVQPLVSKIARAQPHQSEVAAWLLLCITSNFMCYVIG